MADGKIYITITDSRTGGEGGETPPSPPQDPKKPKLVDNSAQQTDPFGEFARHQFYNFITQQANQFVSYSIANIGNFTGDYNKQRQVQNSVNAIKSLGNIATSVFAGASVGGVAGGIVAGGIAIAGEISNTIFSEYTQSFANKKQNHEIEELRKLAGLDSLTNGSRHG